MSAPSLDTSDRETGASRVPVVSCKTAFFCLDRVCGADAIRARIKPTVDEDDIEQGVLPVDRLIAMARKSGLQVREARFNWRALLIATATSPALLLLRNGNVITVLGTGRDGRVEQRPTGDEGGDQQRDHHADNQRDEEQDAGDRGPGR